MFRGFAFLYSRNVTENGGMFVCRSRNLVQAGGSKVSIGIMFLDAVGRWQHNGVT